MTTIRKSGKLFLCAATLALIFGGMGQSQAAEKTLRVLGWNSGQPQVSKLEAPMWANLGKKTNGSLKASFRALDELGLKGTEALRTLQSGAFDIVAIQVAFASGDDPVLVGTDLPGTAYSLDDVKKINASYRSVLERHLQKAYDSKLLATWSFPPQILYCRGNFFHGLADLKGKKVRSQSAAASAAVQALGGSVVSLSGPEVYQAMLQGVVDCAITGSQYAAANNWQDVAKVVYPLPIGGNGVGVHVMRNSSWKALSPAQQSALMAEMSTLENKLQEMAVSSDQEGLNCNTGKGACSIGKPGNMTEVKVSDTERALMKKVSREVIFPQWAQSCNKVLPTCAREWSDTVGKTIGVTLH
jgi:TRAP-type C4-dicarboxylate transport system substrate-binding protein